MNLSKLPSSIIKLSFYLLFIIVPLILTPYNYELFEFNKILVVYFFTIIIATSWLIQSILKRKIIFRKTPFDIPILLFLISQIISTILSIDPVTSIWGYYSRFHGGLLSTISYIILFYAFVNFIDKPVKKNCFKLIIITASLVSIYGILERFGIDKHLWVQDVQNRVFSTLGQPNWLAAYLLTLTPLSIAFSLFQSKLYHLSSVFFLVTIIFTKSRSGLLGLAVALIIFWLLLLIKQGLKKFPIKKALIINLYFGLIILFLGTEFSPSINQIIKNSFTLNSTTGLAQEIPAPAVATGGSKSSDIRKVVWSGSLDIWRHYPIFGSGVETFAYSYYNFRPIEHNHLSEWDYLYNKAHNEFINFLSTTGAFGFLSYCLIILVFLIYTFRKYKSSVRPHLNFVYLALISGFLGMAVSNFFGFSVVAVAMFFFLFPAFVLKPIEPQSLQSKKLNNFQAISITFILVTCFYALIHVINSWRADYLFNLGRGQVKADQLQTGYQNLEASVNLIPYQPVFRNQLAEASAKLAVAFANQTDQKFATTAASYAQTFTNQAILQSDSVINQSPKNLNFWRTRIQIFLRLVSLDPSYQNQALAAFDQAISLAPTDPKIRYNLGLTLNQLGQAGQAEQVLKQVIELKPNYEAARFALGSLFQQTERPDLAKKQYQYILDNLNPNNQTVIDALNKL